MRSRFCGEIVFILHIPIVIIWFGLFFIPLSYWPGRAVFHLWYALTILFIQFFWGLALFRYTKKIDLVCPLTTLMQSVRGFSVKKEKNYRHSFISELFKRIHLKVSYKAVNVINLLSFLLILGIYVWQKMR